MSNHLIRESRFIEPYPQSALGGHLGLKTMDISRSLGVPHGHVLEKIRRGKFLEMCRHLNFKANVDTIANESNGLPFQCFVLDVSASKAFVAKWDNQTGWEYLNFLFACEVIVTERLPSLIEENTDLKKRLAALTKPRLIKGKRNKPDRILIPSVKPCRTLFGEDYQVVHQYLPRTAVTDTEMLVAEISHLINTMNGINAKALRLKKELLISQLPPAQRIAAWRDQ